MGILTAVALMPSAAPIHAGRSQKLVVRGALRAEPRNILVTSMGYYGNASALVMCVPSR